MGAIKGFWRRRTSVAIAITAAVLLGVFSWSTTTILVAQNSTGVIAGKVVADRGEVRALRVSAKDTVHGIIYTVFTRRGQYQIFNLPPATYEVTVDEDELDSSVQTVALRSGETKTADLSLKVKDPSTVLPLVVGGRARAGAELVDFDTLYPPSPARNVIMTECWSCHANNGWHRRGGKTEANWARAVARMFDDQGFDPTGRAGAPKHESKMTAEQKDMIVKYLASLFPPNHKLQELKLDRLVRDEEALAQAIYIQYELPPLQAPNFSDGTRAQAGFHDAAPGLTRETDGIVWLSGLGNGRLWSVDTRNPHATPEQRTKSWLIPTAENINIRPHGIVEINGKVWTSNLYKATLTEFDPKTERFTTYTPETGGPAGVTLYPDSKGNIWWTAMRGDAKLNFFDAATKKITQYDPVDNDPGWYGIIVDKKDRMFAAGYSGYVVPMYDPKTAKWTLFNTTQTNRRPTVDSKGMVFTAQYAGNSIAMINPETGKVTEFKLPLRHGNPYEVSPDAQDNIWIENEHYNSLVKFDQKTKKFTYYPFPVVQGHTPKILRDLRGNAWFELERNLATFRPNGNVPTRSVTTTAAR